MFDLSGRTALVTGAGKQHRSGHRPGSGRPGCPRRGERLLRRASRRGNGRRRSCAGGRERGRPAAFDVTDLDAVKEAVTGIGAVDILVNNAGLAGPTDMKAEQFRGMDPADWQTSVNVNLYGVMNCCHAVLDGMCERGWGRIITISSAAGTHGVHIGVAPYSAGKGGGLVLHPHAGAGSGPLRGDGQHAGARPLRTQEPRDHRAFRQGRSPWAAPAVPRMWPPPASGSPPTRPSGSPPRPSASTAARLRVDGANGAAMRLEPLTSTRESACNGPTARREWL